VDDEVGEETGFKHWTGNARALKCDGNEQAKGEEEVNIVDFESDLLEKVDARDKVINWQSAGEVDESRKDSAHDDGETALNYGGYPYLLLFSS